MSDIELNVGSGKKCSGCGGTVASGRETCQNCGRSFSAETLEDRVAELERTVLALAAQRLEFGDSPGHPFRGNQYSGGQGGSDVQDNALSRVMSALPKAYQDDPNLERVLGRAMARSSNSVNVVDEVSRYLSPTYMRRQGWGQLERAVKAEQGRATDLSDANVAEKMVPDVVKEGPSTGVADRGEWELGVEHAANAIADGQETVDSLLKWENQDVSEWTSSFSGSPISSPESYVQGLVDLANTLRDNQ